MNDDDNLIKFLEKIQKKIEYKEKQIYSKVVIHEYRNPSNFGSIDNPDAVGKIKGPCGDTMKISLKIEKEKIKDVSFWTDGCGATIACGSKLTKMIKGKTIDEVTNISYDKLISELKGLPKEHIHCSKLAVNTLNKTIKKYFAKKNC